MKRTAIAAAVLLACGTANAEDTFQLDLGTTFANSFQSSDGTAALISYGSSFRIGLGYISSQSVKIDGGKDCFDYTIDTGYDGEWCYERPDRKLEVDSYAFLQGTFTHEFREGRTFRPLFTMGLTLQEKQGNILSSNYSFLTAVGFRVDRFSLTWTHLSNAGLEGANWGQDFITMGYRWD
ncbi:MAG: acyloxyacyl hydrolase [Acidimicrobiia bacterium]|nr:acyloxyacyl hydrolase [Acidimicrobiia bacterium]